MANVIYRDDSGRLKIGVDSDSEMLRDSVYRSQSDKEIVKRDGMFVELDLDGSGSRNLCATN